MSGEGLAFVGRGHKDSKTGGEEGPPSQRKGVFEERRVEEELSGMEGLYPPSHFPKTMFHAPIPLTLEEFKTSERESVPAK